MMILSNLAEQLRHPAIPPEHVAVELECLAANPLPIAIEFCEHLEHTQPLQAEFWRRLAGSLRRGAALCAV